MWKNRPQPDFAQAMSDYIDSQGFRANVGIVLMRDGGELFLGGRRDGRGWQFPQGGVQRNEQPEEALYRELHEEIGLERSDVELVASTRRWLRYRLPHQYVRRRGSPVCIGQKQRWFLLRMLGDDSRFNFAATAEPEFDQGRWVDYWAPVREVIYFKRAVYVRALQELGDQAFATGAPPRPDWLTDEMLRTPQSRTPGHRRRPGGGTARAGSEDATTDAPVAAGAPAGHDQ
jgi:putative (di)nucleoside polyphosphate hydrolase